MNLQPKFQPERLKKLADHLLNGQLKSKPIVIRETPEVIDYGDSIDTIYDYHIFPLQESVYIFPDWKLIGRFNSPVWVHDEMQTPFSSAVEFFGLELEFFDFLFIPNKQHLAQLIGGNILKGDSGPKEIAENMLCLIKAMEEDSKS